MTIDIPNIETGRNPGKAAAKRSWHGIKLIETDRRPSTKGRIE